MTAAVDLPARSSIEAPGSRHQPNPDRPSNPFTPNKEPDWIVVPKAAASQVRGNHGTPETSSTHTSHRSQTPLEPAGSLRLASVPRDDEPLASDRALISKTASFASSSSSSTSVIRKPAPPVPKKSKVLGQRRQPNELAALGKGDVCARNTHITSATHTPQPWSVSSSASRSSSPPLSHRTANPGQAFTSNRQTPTLPPPRRSRGPLINLVDVDEGGPPLPPRRPSQLAVNRGGIMDESVDDAQSIPSLQPRRA